MSNKAEFLIVGVNHHFQEPRKLKAAERDAQAIFDIFRNFGLARDENCRLLKGKEVTPDGVRNELDRIGKLDHKDVLFIYWAGHAEKLDGEGVWLLTNKTGDRDHPHDEMVVLETLVGSFARFQGFKKYVLILDTCYSGTAIDIFGKLKPDDFREGTKYEILAACEKTETARENPGRYGWLTEIVLEELKKIFNNREQTLNLSNILAQSAARLPLEKSQTTKYATEGGGYITLDIPARPINRETTSDTDFLETAIGYATKAFSTYLNNQIVSGVELIYFLGFDVWDGCLVYDGLIHGSIEQQLLEFIRHKFLDRDRLRSRYEEILAKPPKTDISRLGIAGQCLRDARNCYEDNLKQLIKFAQSENSFIKENRILLDSQLKTPTVEGLRYIGDLSSSQYSSEYEAYDLLLGLRSCLYIPVVEQFFDFDILTSSDDEIREKVKKAESELLQIKYGRKPLGGVLIAANRKPHGLTLKINGGESQSQSDEDKSITERIGKYFNTSRKSYSNEYSDFRYHLRCLNAVYVEKNEKKNGLRQGLHPSLLKRSVKNIKEATNNSDVQQETLDLFVFDIAGRIEEERLQHESPLDFAKALQDGINNFLPKNLGINKDQALDFIRIYLVGILWRDFRIQKDVYSDNNSDIERDLNSPIKDILQPQELKSSNNNFEQPTLNNYIVKPISRQVECPFYYSADAYPEPGEVSRLILALLNDLLDDLREVKKQPSEIVYYYLKSIAPIKKYVNSVSKLEGIFSSSINQKIFCDLSHALSVWLVGLWILEKSLGSSKVKVKNRIVAVIDEYFNTLPDPYKQTFKTDILEKSQYLKEDFIPLFWGIIAAIHDIAIPVQRFKDSCKIFFCQFFGEETISQLRRGMQFNIIDVLDHPRFPIYKNAITSLYSIDPSLQNTTQRDWLECVFHRAVGKNIGHSTVGSLILVYELEPYSDYCSEPSMWRMVKSYLQELSDSQKERKEYGLFIPAYLAHAVAFSDLPKLQKLWKEMQADWQTNQPNNNNNNSYFGKTADNFQISFEEYPLTYLLGLLETILEPTDDDNRLDKNIIKLVNNSNCEDIFDYHSNFYIENVEVETDQEQDKVVLCLSLNLWENNMLQESEKIKAEDMTILYRHYQNELNTRNDNHSNNNRRDWLLYSQEEFDRCSPTWRSSDVVYNEFNEFFDILDNRFPISKRLSPRAYKVLDMIYRLKDFRKYFKSSKWEVKIKFCNVKTNSTNDPLVLPDYFVKKRVEF